MDPAELLVDLGLSQALGPLGWTVALRIQPIAEEASPYPAEREVVAHAVGSRRAEFASGRAAARLALADLGRPVGPIGRRPDRSPDWPAGVIGSISHAAGLVVAVVAVPASAAGPGLGAPAAPAAIGIDLEPDVALPAAVADRILSPAERDVDPAAAVDPLVVFSAKEAVFKAVNPSTGRWLEFEDVSIRLDGSTFEARLAGPAQPSVVTGGWLRRDGFVLTACLVRSR